MAEPELKVGELNAGLIVIEGSPSYWLIIIGGTIVGSTWVDAKAWANSKLGELPNITELSFIMNSSSKESFMHDVYWSIDEINQDYAWAKSMHSGSVVKCIKNYPLPKTIAIRKVNV